MDERRTFFCPDICYLHVCRALDRRILPDDIGRRSVFHGRCSGSSLKRVDGGSMGRRTDISGGRGRLARHDLYVVLAVSACFVLVLIAKSAMDFSRSGPQIADEIARSYLGYAVYALARLGAWAFAITALMAAAGVFVYHCLATVFKWRYRWQLALGSAILAAGIITFTSFVHFLLYMPGGVMASFNYRANRLYPLWEILTPGRVTMLEWGVVLLFAVPALLALVVLMRRREWRRSALVTGIAVPPMALLLGWNGIHEPSAAPLPASSQGRPNILMIGSDTLRADRLGVNGYTRLLTPNIDGLAAKGTNFSQYIVPIGRTAPSLLSLLTGTWPHTHGVRDNYVGDRETQLPHPALPGKRAKGDRYGNDETPGYSPGGIACPADQQFPAGRRYRRLRDRVPAQAAAGLGLDAVRRPAADRASDADPDRLAAELDRLRWPAHGLLADLQRHLAPGAAQCAACLILGPGRSRRC